MTPGAQGLASTDTAAQEAALRRELLLGVFDAVLRVIPIAFTVNLALFLLHPSVVTFSLALGPTSGIAFSLWGRRRLRQGDVIWPPRAVSMVTLILMPWFVLQPYDALTLLGAAGVSLMVVVAPLLHPARAAVWWSGAALVAYVLALALRNTLGLPHGDLGPVVSVAVWVLPVLLTTVLAVIGRSSTRRLLTALLRSEAMRRDLEQQKAELEGARASLAGFAQDLERSNRDLQSFASVVSHDLRAPLRALVNYSRFLGEEYAEKLDANGREYLDGIGDSARRMDSLVAGILEYSRIGRDKGAPEPVDVGALLESVVASLHLCDRADVHLPVDAPVVSARPIRLEQIFTNLLDNAAKFHPLGVRPVVKVEWADSGTTWEFAVRDNGIGIDAKHFDKIFGMFQRLHAPSEYEGTGIGLAIVQKAVEEHGGRIEVESTPGQGSVFRFTLPKPASA